MHKAPQSITSRALVVSFLHSMYSCWEISLAHNVLRSDGWSPTTQLAFTSVHDAWCTDLEFVNKHIRHAYCAGDSTEIFKGGIPAPFTRHGNSKKHFRVELISKRKALTAKALTGPLVFRTPPQGRAEKPESRANNSPGRIQHCSLNFRPISLRPTYVVLLTTA